MCAVTLLARRYQYWTALHETVHILGARAAEMRQSVYAFVDTRTQGFRRTTLRASVMLLVLPAHPGIPIFRFNLPVRCAYHIRALGCQVTQACFVVLRRH